MKKKIIVIAGIFWSLFIFNRAMVASVNKEFKPIMNHARAYVMANSTQSCWYVDIVPIRIMGDWALAEAQPDMKICITDAVLLVMHRKDGLWEGFTMGLCCFEGVPASLIGGNWPQDENGFITGEGPG
jgi:hypothetical protein